VLPLPRHAVPVTAAPAAVAARSWARRVVVVVGLVGYTIWDEALLSTPVVASVGWIGAWPTFVAFSVLYATGGFVLSLLVVRAYAKRLGGEVQRAGIDVCVVAPGPVRTAMLEEALGRPVAPRGGIGRALERAYFMDADECVRRSLDGLRRGQGEVVVDPVDRAVVRLPHGVLERVDAWSLRHLTGTD
jgi:hypothetical protein